MVSSVLDVVDKVGSGSGLVALVFLIYQNLRSRPRISFELHGASGEEIKKHDLRQYRYSTSGLLKNRSLAPNAVTKVYLTVWANKNKTSYLRFGYEGLRITDTLSKQQLLTIQLAPKEAKSIEINFEFPLTGTSDEKLIFETVLVEPGLTHRMRKHEYELCFEDVNGNMFDASGQHINRDEADLRWTLPNTLCSIQNGNPWPFIAHWFAIFRARLKHQLRLLIQALGLWR